MSGFKNFATEIRDAMEWVTGDEPDATPESVLDAVLKAYACAR